MKSLESGSVCRHGTGSTVTATESSAICNFDPMLVTSRNLIAIQCLSSRNEYPKVYMCIHIPFYLKIVDFIFMEVADTTAHQPSL